MRNSRYVADLLKSEDEQIQKMHDIIRKAIEEEALVSTKITELEPEERSLGEMLSDKVAEFGGSWKFIIIFCSFMFVWICFNTYVMSNKSFDPYPYIFAKSSIVLYCRYSGSYYYDDSKSSRNKR